MYRLRGVAFPGKGAGSESTLVSQKMWGSQVQYRYRARHWCGQVDILKGIWCTVRREKDSTWRVIMVQAGTGCTGSGRRMKLACSFGGRMSSTDVFT